MTTEKKTTPATAAEIRGRREFIGHHAAEFEAKEALSGWQREINSIKVEAREPAGLKSGQRLAMETALREQSNLGDLLTELEPVYRHDMGPGATRFVDEGNSLYTRSGDDAYIQGDMRGKNVAAPGLWATKMATAVRRIGPEGRKAVVSGSLDAPTVVVDAVADPQSARRLLELIPAKAVSENNYAYVRQTLRTNNAAPVADHGTKPTSIFTFEEVEDRARVVAHLSEPIPQRYFDDHGEVVQLLRSEMAYGVISALEDQVLNGDGTGENFEGILTVTGTTAVAFDTDTATTLRNARTQMATLAEDVTAFVLHPSDYADVELGADPNLDLRQRIFGGVPVVQSIAVPVGTGLLADWRATRLYVREGGRLDLDAGGALFDKNEIKLRAEQRANVAILRPQAVAVIDLTAL